MIIINNFLQISSGSVVTAPHNRSLSSHLTATTRSAVTDVDDWRRRRRPRPKMGRSSKRATSLGPKKSGAGGDDRRKHINKMMQLYTGQVHSSPKSNPSCPHCETPDTKYCSGTGRQHDEQTTPMASSHPNPDTPARSPTLSSSAIAVLMRARERDAVRKPPNLSERVSQVPVRLNANEVLVTSPNPIMKSGDVLSPCGSSHLSPSTAPRRQPSQRSYRDDDEVILRVSQSLKAARRSLSSPISTSSMPPESEVNALLKWTDQLQP